MSDALALLALTLTMLQSMAMFSPGLATDVPTPSSTPDPMPKLTLAPTPYPNSDPTQSLTPAPSTP
jgi:hypothetical protein